LITSSDVALPMPWAAPVTMMTRPSRETRSVIIPALSLGGGQRFYDDRAERTPPRRSSSCAIIHLISFDANFSN
jgi:hypothetical protein